jgi:hypothetical protein
MNGNGEEGKELTRRLTWEQNHARIQDAYLQLFQKTKRIPTMQEVADLCQLSRNTVWKHCNELQLSDIVPRIKVRADRILFGLATKAEKGDAAAAKLFFQLTFGWREASEHYIGNLEKLKDIDFATVSTDRLKRIAAGEPAELVLSDRFN